MMILMTKHVVEATFSKKISPANYSPMFFSSDPIRKIPSQKHFGIILDSKLSFISHINAVISKCKQGIGLLKLLSNYIYAEHFKRYIQLYI